MLLIVHGVLQVMWEELAGKVGHHRHRKRGKGYAGYLTPPTIYVGDIDMYIPEKSDNNIYVEFQST